MTTLVSFIGNPSKSHSGPAHGTRGPSVAATSEYEATDYVFEDGGFRARSLFSAGLPCSTFGGRRSRPESPSFSRIDGLWWEQ